MHVSGETLLMYLSLCMSTLWDLINILVIDSYVEGREFYVSPGQQ